MFWNVPESAEVGALRLPTRFHLNFRSRSRLVFSIFLFGSSLLVASVVLADNGCGSGGGCFSAKDPSVVVTARVVAVWMVND